MEFIVTKTIPVKELGEYKDYVGFLFINEDGKYNLCQTLDKVIDSNKWSKNLPVHTIVVSDDKVQVGDTFLATATNQELHGKTFKYLGATKDGVDLIDIEDKDGNKVTSTIHLLKDAYKFIRKANETDKLKVVNGIIRNLDF